MITWTRNAYGWTAEADGHRWTVRGPIMAAAMWWLYRDGNRVTETGSYEDALTFPTAAAAKKYVAEQTNQEPTT
jgi:hypothetical protein